VQEYASRSMLKYSTKHDESEAVAENQPIIPIRCTPTQNVSRSRWVKGKSHIFHSEWAGGLLALDQLPESVTAPVEEHLLGCGE
jgi:hypothetical protein